MHLTENFDLKACAARRAALMRRLPKAVLIRAGHLKARNYAGNPYSFRASSHFLYLVGVGLPDAVLHLADGEAVLFVQPPGPNDALWHGPSPSLAELGVLLGLTVAPLAELPAGAELPDPELADALIAGRLIHDAAAQTELRQAAAFTAAAHRAGMAATQPGIREWTVRAAMEGAMMQQGVGPAYGSIVTVHGEVLHAHSHHGFLRDGDLLLADVGAESRGGWAADVTRTWPVSGTFSKTQQAIYEVVLAAENAAIDKVRPGVSYKDVHMAACIIFTQGLIDLGILRGSVPDLVNDDVHALFFPHGVGHLLGLDVHDMEDLGDRAGYAPGRTRSKRFGLGYLRLNRDLEPGMAVTVEPGFYQVPAILNDPERMAKVGDRLNRITLAKYADVRGIRIEDDVLVTVGEPEVLTAAIPKTVAHIQAEVLR